MLTMAPGAAGVDHGLAASFDSRKGVVALKRSGLEVAGEVCNGGRGPGAAGVVHQEVESAGMLERAGRGGGLPSSMTSVTTARPVARRPRDEPHRLAEVGLRAGPRRRRRRPPGRAHCAGRPMPAPPPAGRWPPCPSRRNRSSTGTLGVRRPVGPASPIGFSRLAGHGGPSLAPGLGREREPRSGSIESTGVLPCTRRRHHAV